MFWLVYAEFYSTVIEPLFEGERKYYTLSVLALIGAVIWYIRPKAIFARLDWLLLGAFVLAMLGLIIYVLRILMLDRRDRWAFSQGYDLALATFQPGEYPPLLSPEQSEVDRVCREAGIPSNHQQGLAATTWEGYVSGALLRFSEKLVAAHPRIAEPDASVDDCFDAYVASLGDDFRYAPYLREYVRSRFGYELGEKWFLQDLEQHYARYRWQGSRSGAFRPTRH